MFKKCMFPTLHITAFLNESNFYTFFWGPKWMDIVLN